jgi:hypothetical protein
MAAMMAHQDGRETAIKELEALLMNFDKRNR